MRNKRYLIKYETDECKQAVLNCRHAETLEDVKKYLRGVMRTRTVYVLEYEWEKERSND